MGRTHHDLTESERAFLVERHPATFSSIRTDGSPHVVAIAFTFHPDEGLVRIITSDGSQKVRNVERAGQAAVCQVDGPRWLTLQGPARIRREPAEVARAVAAFESRYRPARENSRRVAIEISVERVLGRA